MIFIIKKPFHHKLSFLNEISKRARREKRGNLIFFNFSNKNL